MTSYDEIKSRSRTAHEESLGEPTERSAINFAPTQKWEGQLFGGLVLSAFLLYGVGSSMADQGVGLVMVAVNSIAVAVVGVLGFRLLRNRDPQAGKVYLAARLAEAVLLGGGIALAEFGDVSGADNTGYLLGMIVLGAGSLPFWRAAGRAVVLPQSFVPWGVAGYTALATGALLELVTGRDLLILFAVPGGLFEIAVGAYLLAKGFVAHRSGGES